MNVGPTGRDQLPVEGDAPAGSHLTRRFLSHLVASGSPDGSHPTWGSMMASASPRDIFLIHFCDSSVPFRLESTHIINIQHAEFPCNRHPVSK